MEIKNISTPGSPLPWKHSMGLRKLSDIKYVVFHHDASLAPETYDAVDLYTHEAAYHISKGWGHLGYSMRIARDGTVYQTVPLEEIGVHAGNYRYFRNSFGVCLDGSFDRQKPSDAQLKAVKDLMVYLAHKRPDLPGVVEKSMYVHKEVRILPTFCCGDVVKNIVKTYRLTGK